MMVDSIVQMQSKKKKQNTSTSCTKLLHVVVKAVVGILVLLQIYHLWVTCMFLLYSCLPNIVEQLLLWCWSLFHQHFLQPFKCKEHSDICTFAHVGYVIIFLSTIYIYEKTTRNTNCYYCCVCSVKEVHQYSCKYITSESIAGS